MDNSFGASGGFKDWLDQLQQTGNVEQPDTGSFETPSVEDQISALPNSEKLTEVERWLYKKLPGVTENSTFKAVMNGLEWGPAAKFLTVLDSLAEGSERTLGLIAQYKDMEPGEEFILKDAWAAGSLFWDTVRLPRVGRDKDGRLRIQMDTDLPGAYAVTEARRLLSEGATMEEVRERMYANMGALALRSQLQDTLGHVIVDPLNWMTAAIKPVQRAHAIRNLALAGKLDTKYVKALEQAARAAGNIGDADKFAEAIATAERQGKALTRFDRFIINLTGGVPYLQKGEDGYKLLDVSTLTPFQQKLMRLNPFALTPQSRASELLDMVSANIGEQLIAPNWGKDPEEFLKALQGAARGAVGSEWGHLAGTIQGRTVQALLSNADGVSKVLGAEWRTYADQRAFLARLARFFPDMDERRLWQAANRNPRELIERIAKMASQPGNEALALELKAGRINEQMLSEIGKIDKAIPLMREEFYLKARIAIEDIAVRQAVTQFGIKERGVLTKWTDALKAWESVPFIKVNPANTMRNLVNNDVTLLGRGLYGTMTGKQIDDFWKGKYMPSVFERGFSLTGDEFADDALFDPGNAIKALEEALTGAETSADRAKKAASRLNLGFLDFSKMSAKFERAASKRASTMGWIQFHQEYWNPRTGFTSITKTLDPATLERIEAIAPGLTRLLDDVAQSSGADSAKFAKAMEMSLEINAASVFNAAEEALGFKLSETLGADIIHRIEEGLPDAMRNGTVQSFVDGIKADVERHIDDMFSRHVENLPGIVAGQVQAGGPLQFHRIFGKASGELWGGNVEHAMRMSTINEALDYARKTGDYKRARSIWQKILRDSENHYRRVWNKFEAYEEGLRQGAKNAGIPYPQEVSGAFKEMRQGWERFFEFRNSAYDEILSEGKNATRSFEDVQKTLDSMYDALVAKEDDLYRRIDDLMADSIPDDLLRDVYRNSRDQIANLRREDRLHTQQFMQKIRTVPADEAPPLWKKYWGERGARLEQIRQVEARSSAALQGDSESIQLFMSRRTATEEPKTVVDLANQYGIATATDKGARNSKRILNTINKYRPEGQAKYTKLEDVPLDVARQAFETRRATKAGEATTAARSFIPDAEKMLPDPFPIETGLSELNYGRGYAALDAIVDEAVGQSQQTSRLLKDLPEELQAEVKKWMRQVDGDMSSFRSAGVQYAAFRRDSALLNYNRRTNFDNMVGHVAPFAFWTTHSVFNWAIHSLDRPAMLTNYFRQREFFETAGLPGQNVPYRMKGHIRVNLPFTPDWMGDTFINPIRFALPFDGFLSPWEQAQTGKLKQEAKVEKTLEQMLEQGVITEEQYQEAIKDREGEVWDRAELTVKDGGDSYDAMDFATMMMTPHAPLMWAYNAAKGEKQDIGPFTPMSRTVKNVATMLGVEDWSNSPYNVEGRIRKSMGLPAYDKWEDYRVQREISNMSVDGKYSLEEMRRAMELGALVESGKMDPEDAKRESPLYKEAVRRSNIEFAGGWVGTISSMLGMPVRAYPEGEEKQRELAEKFSEAYMRFDAGDIDALTDFFDQYPEYESRLALFKSPEERLKRFQIDNLWQRWNEIPKVNQNEIREQLGDNFATLFLDSTTQNYEAITNEQLQIWLALTKGKQIGRLSAETEALIELNQLKLTDPATAWRVQTFYDARKTDFTDFYKWQNEYYGKKTDAEKKAYLNENPQLREYWDFRRRWMEKNPDLARFLTDDEKQLAKFANIRRNPEVAVPTREELASNFSPEMGELLQGWTSGEDLPFVMDEYLETLSAQYGLTPRQILGIMTGK